MLYNNPVILYSLKLLTLLLRATTKNSGTALPGLLLEKYFPNTLKKLLAQFDDVILITGTNGKTTTTQMVCHLLKAQNVDFVTNTSGSNLIRGIASSVLDKTKNGKVQAKLGIFEVEEATMPLLSKLVRPRLIVVTNIFRDQLDAYGEIDKTLRYIREAIESSNNPILILNGDDPRVQNLSNYSNGEINFVKLDPKLLEQIKFEDSNVDIKSNITINTKVWNIKNISIDDMSMEDFNSFSDIFKIDILEVIKIENCVNQRESFGGTSKNNVLMQITNGKEFLKNYK